MNKNKVDYKLAGVDIGAGNEAVDLIKDGVKSTFSNDVLMGLGGFGALYDLKSIIKEYKNPVLVQSIDGVGTKTIIARKLKKYDTIGIDLLSAAANDIVVMGARPITFLDYIANDRLEPSIIKELVSGMVKACKETNVSLVGGETAEMPDTYLPGEHDLVGVITGVVEKNEIISGTLILPGDIILGIPSSGIHTNGYSLARKIFFDVGNYEINDTPKGLSSPVGLTLLEPHINYTNDVFKLLDNNIVINGMAHITGGGLIENIPRVLPKNCVATIRKGSWDVLPVFTCMESIGNIDEHEMFRTFNMGIGMVVIVPQNQVSLIKDLINVVEIGKIEEGERGVKLI